MTNDSKLNLGQKRFPAKRMSISDLKKNLSYDRTSMIDQFPEKYTTY